MTNFEKWKDEILKITHDDYEIAVKDGVPKPCVGICDQCEFERESPCIAKFVDWLLAEYQEPAPKLTRREREFLECFLNTSKRTISRDLTSGLLGFGYSGNCYDRLKEDMFQFIKKGECWTFEDLLKLEVEE